MSYLSQLRQQAVNSYWKSIYSVSNPLQNGTLLDCGCGDGKDTLAFAQHIQADTVQAIEIDKDNIRSATQLGIATFAEDLNKSWSLKDQTYDAILANQVIEHLHDTDNFFSEIYRVLKPNGWAIICTENLASWHNIVALFLGYTPFSMTNTSGLTGSLGNPLAFHNKDAKAVNIQHPSYQHIKVFTVKGLVHLAQLVGFHVEQVVGVGYYPFPTFAWPIFCKLDKNHSAFMTIKVRKPT